MRFRPSAVLALVAVAASGCGSTSSEPRAAEALEPAPPIEAIDEPIHELWPTGDVVYDIPLGPEDADPGTVERRDLSPASGTVPHAVARLRPARKGGPTARIIAWRTQSGELCVEPEAKVDEPWNRAGIVGPCTRECQELCLESLDVGDRPFESSVLAGVVATRADELSIVFDDGKTARFPLTGPTIPGFPAWRTFMVDLGDQLYAELELSQAGKQLDRVVLPAENVRAMRCFREELRATPKAAVREIYERCSKPVEE